jgi:5-carboxymethyl-2-hydroxymuconate isomerase
MPHLEIKYSADIELDVNVLFDQIESAINELDPSAGVCKSRAYPAKSYKHSHVMIEVWLLLKQHRNHAFTQALLKRLKDCVKKKVADHCYISVQLHYRDANYVTIE